ncbi:Hypothetical_protein [Hexamita inflata]|uniref:Hypothetical_protein n=1 Tax=Hexamita inflata TaxID=28002 RepID=A0AA86R2M5_9EUKA|nr:Hypothetical protein HINF_LOCUS52239 [Hexamita inflata]
MSAKLDIAKRYGFVLLSPSRKRSESPQQLVIPFSAPEPMVRKNSQQNIRIQQILPSRTEVPAFEYPVERLPYKIRAKSPEPAPFKSMSPQKPIELHPVKKFVEKPAPKQEWDGYKLNAPLSPQAVKTIKFVHQLQAQNDKKMQKKQTDFLSGDFNFKNNSEETEEAEIKVGFSVGDFGKEE